MVQYFDSIPNNVLNWIPRQHVFFVASAPLKADGHVNISPKCAEGTFHIVNTNKVWYEDLTGSGVETVSHIRENGRITVMFTAFDGPPNIVRLYGVGSVHEFGSSEYDELIPPETRKPGSRAAIVVDIYQVATSCGYSIPFFNFDRHRTMLLEWASTREETDLKADKSSALASSTSERPEKGLKNYWVVKNTKSVDGLPGITNAPEAKCSFREENLFKSNKSKHGSGVPSQAGPSVKKSRSCGPMIDEKTLVGLGSFVAGVSVALAYARFATL